MTTHFMEEADSLGDRICIMSKGSITALGTSVELKNKFGVGYQLILLKQDNFDRDRTEEFLAATLDHSVAPIRLLSDNMAEISYQVPFVHVPRFPNFIRSLKTAASELGVKTFVLQPTTLEEVFLRLAKDEDEE
jgi:ATP-binding cassette, subfamily A (ABC1), member 3